VQRFVYTLGMEWGRSLSARGFKSRHRLQSIPMNDDPRYARKTLTDCATEFRGMMESAIMQNEFEAAATCKTFLRAIEAADAELAELRADKARLDWLERHAYVPTAASPFTGGCHVTREAIDSVRLNVPEGSSPSDGSLFKG